MLKVIKADIWRYLEQGYSIVIPTNGHVNTDGRAVMGKGVAYQASKLFKNLDVSLGNQIKKQGNKLFYFPRQKLITFPTKEHWKYPSKIELIVESAKALKVLLDNEKDLKVAMPKVGCGWGKLDWDKDVSHIISQILGDYSDKRLIIVDNEQGDAGQDFRGDNKENIKGSTDKDTKPRIVNANEFFAPGV